MYGPPVGKKLVIFIDDMNMPKVDTYGTQQPITLLLTLMSRGFIYDRAKDLTAKILKDLHLTPKLRNLIYDIARDKQFCLAARPSDTSSLLKMLTPGARLATKGMAQQLTHQELLSLAFVCQDLIHASGEELVSVLRERDELKSTIDHRFDYMKKLLHDLPPRERWHAMTHAGEIGLAELDWD